MVRLDLQKNWRTLDSVDKIDGGNMKAADGKWRAAWKGSSGRGRTRVRIGGRYLDG